MLTPIHISSVAIKPAIRLVSRRRASEAGSRASRRRGARRRYIITRNAVSPTNTRPLAIAGSDTRGHAVAGQHHDQVTRQRQRDATLLNEHQQEDGLVVVTVDQPQQELRHPGPQLHLSPPRGRWPRGSLLGARGGPILTS